MAGMEMESSWSGNPEQEQSSPLQAASDVETKGQPGQLAKRARTHRRWIALVVLLLCLLLVLVLAVIFGLKHKTDNTDSWLQRDCEDMTEPQCPARFWKPPVILVSMDGFRAWYLKAHANLLPVISKLRQCGTSSPYMRPAYPTKTFPNHYTIATGLYPESHGIVDNKMYDVTLNTSFSLKTGEKFNSHWYRGQPIWLTAKYNHLKSGTYFWPGSDVPINGSYPNLYKTYDGRVAFEERVRTILEWLDLPKEERPDFYTLYFDQPDTAGHQHGPESSQVADALRHVDEMMGLLMDGLQERNLHRCVNLVLLSDHGMEEASCHKAVFLSTYQNNINDFNVIQGPAGRVRPNRLPHEFYTFDYEGLMKNLSCRAAAMTPYLKEHLPKRLHFASSVRIERLHLYMKEQWQVALKDGDMKYCKGGFHGSDNVFKNMQTIFIAYGPSLKTQTIVPPFENIEVYNLLCDLLGVPPAPNNGTHGSLNHLLKNPTHLPVYPAELSPASVCSHSNTETSHSLGCDCPGLSRSQVETLNQQLLSDSPGPGVKSVNLPFGMPRLLQRNARHCVLHQHHYVTGYSTDTLTPLWVSYTLQPMSSISPMSQAAVSCVRPDVRIPTSHSQACNRSGNSLVFGFLHPPNFVAENREWDSLITSNMAPMFPTFKGMWEYFHNVMLLNYSQELNGINIMSGPIFDHNFDGIYDQVSSQKPHEAPVATHFYVIVTSCRDRSLSLTHCVGPLQAVAFILPHRSDNSDICNGGADHRWVQAWAQLHVARVRDVELLTGLSFYHERVSVSETLRLKTSLHTFQTSY